MSAAARGEAAPAPRAPPSPPPPDPPAAPAGPPRPDSGRPPARCASAVGAPGPARQPPGSSGAPESGGLPLRVHPHQPRAPHRTPCTPRAPLAPELGDTPHPPLRHPQELLSPFPGLGGPPSCGLSGAPAGVIVGGDPGGTLSLNCATWGTVAPRARGPWVRPAVGPNVNLGKLMYSSPPAPNCLHSRGSLVPAL